MKTVVVGLDAFSPVIVERLLTQGHLPHLGHYVQRGGYARFAVANPPQSEVSWTSIATGLNPGAHGIFDFVHRDPAHYTPFVSLLPTRRSWQGPTFAHPFNAPTLFDQAVADGFPATALWWPAMFPARPQSPVKTFPGLGTPDLHGRLGVGTLFTSQRELGPRTGKTPVNVLHARGQQRWAGEWPGPNPRAAPLTLELDVIDEQTARCQLGHQTLTLMLGQWSPVLELTFKLNRFITLRAVSRLILTQLQPEVRVYALPQQIHPLNSPWHYATPPGFVKHIWRTHGPFLTIGWPQDTTGLEDGCITDEQFLALCDSIFTTRAAILLAQLEQFSEGVLASIFDSLDRIQHMFWRSRPDVIEQWYHKLDALVGQVLARLSQSPSTPGRLVVVSDHGFADFNYKVHLNRWLIEQGYLATTPDATSLSEARWPESQAYAFGLNSLYLNRAGREGQGRVTAEGVATLQHQLREALVRWRGPDNQPVIQQVWTQAEAFSGTWSTYGPDLVVGFAPGYRASAQTGLGQWEKESLEANHDHWHGDHCFAPAAVPGVLLASDELHQFPNPTYSDIPPLVLGKAVEGRAAPPPPPPMTQEEQDIVEERLKSLGYL